MGNQTMSVSNFRRYVRAQSNWRPQKVCLGIIASNLIIQTETTLGDVHELRSIASWVCLSCQENFIFFNDTEKFLAKNIFQLQN